MDRAGITVLVICEWVGAVPAIERWCVMVPWRVIFFAINFAACLGWVALSAHFIATDADWSVFTAVIGAILASPGIAVAVAEWLLFARRVPRLERPLGVVAGLAGALGLFALIANAAEALGKGGSSGAFFWLWFGNICLVISAYGFWCCWLRVRRQTLVEPRGFPMDGAAAP